MSKKLLTFLTTALFSSLAMALTPLPSSADVCQGSQCQVTFSYTGGAQTWNVPQGATNISFDVQGAAGGRGGGLGGRVTGVLAGSFTQLQIYVGGAGQTGALVNGGFNGGGKAGGSRTNEGSGGGASDIRLSNSLESRLVVAGGGGGTGGFSGGPGGHGGGEIATAGQAGQGGGGGGGTQTQGGARGSNNGGYVLATAGSFGEGGIGGVSWNAGGGGGGGGWYGGGGGGSDEDDCCGDGGGGGGGSSYANPNSTANVLHTAGYKSGHGLVVISYELSPQLLNFSGDQLDLNSAKFSLEYNMPLAGLETSDLILNGEGCSINSLLQVGNRQEIVVENCLGNPELIIPPASFTIFAAEPANTLSATVTMDRTGPVAQFSHTISSLSSVVLRVTVSDAVNIATTDSFSVSGCQTFSITTSPALEITLDNCVEGNAEVRIAKGGFQDEFGNQSDTISHQVRFDYSPPVLSWSEPAISGSDPFDAVILLTANEEFVFDFAVLQLYGTAQSCSHSVTQGSTSYQLEIRGCSSGELVIEIPANSVTDQAGFQSPATTLSKRVQLARVSQVVESVGAAARDSEPEPISVAPVVTPDVQTESDAVIIDDDTDEFTEIPAVIVRQDQVGSPSPIKTSNPEPLTEPAVTLSQNAKSDNEVLSAEPVVFELQDSTPQHSGYLLSALVVIATLSLGGLGALLMRLAENNRSRSIK
jgi:hypothetical protein